MVASTMSHKSRQCARRWAAGPMPMKAQASADPVLPEIEPAAPSRCRDGARPGTAGRRRLLVDVPADSRGSTTAWPRLITGKSSVTPCRMAMMMACSAVMDDPPVKRYVDAPAPRAQHERATSRRSRRGAPSRRPRGDARPAPRFSCRAQQPGQHGDAARARARRARPRAMAIKRPRQDVGEAPGRKGARRCSARSR